MTSNPTRTSPVKRGRWVLELAQPVKELPRGKLTVSVKDKQGNVTRIDRTFSVGPPTR